MGRKQKQVTISQLELAGIPVVDGYDAPETLERLAGMIGMDKQTLLKAVERNGDSEFTYRLRVGLIVERIPNK